MTIPEPGQRANDELFGREHELGRVRALLAGSGTQGGVLLLRGGPGTGKSSLLKSAVAAARTRRRRVVAVNGVRPEADLPFAGLHRLIQPFLDRLGQLAEPQRDAVRAAFGLSATARPDPFLIALAVLSLLAETASGDPLLVAVDDAQWLDRASCEVLAIVARRLEPTPVILIAAARSGRESPLASTDLPALDLRPLAADAAHALLSASFPLLTETERERVLADAGGNPLALLELPGTVRAGRSDGHGTLPLLTPRLEQAFAIGDLGLPDAARRALLIAAASDTENLDEVLAATALLATALPGAAPVTVDSLAPAVRGQIIQVEGTVIRFCPPLARSAVYAEASLPERQAAHDALARLLDGQPERQTWHRAATVTGPDEAMAEELERVAGQALRRGAVAVAVAVTERAATLTAGAPLRGSRLLHAAELARDLGRGDAVRRLVTAAQSLPLRDTDQVKAAWLAQVADPALGDDPEGLRRQLELADRAGRAGDPDLALRILVGIAISCFWTGHDGQLEPLRASLERLPVSVDHPRRLAVLAFADPVGQGAVVTEALSRMERRLRTEARAAYPAGVAATVVGDVRLGASLLADAVTLLRAQGQRRWLARALVVQAWAATHLADWEVAGSAAREGIRLAAETDQPLFETVGQGSLLVLAALRGDEDAVRSLSPLAQQRLAAGRSRYGLAVVHAARGLSDLGGARYDEAYEHLRRIFDPGDPACHPAQQRWYIHDFVEAAVRSGHHEQARAALSAAEPDRGAAPSPWLHAGLRYAQALLAEDDRKERLFLEAVDAAGSLPFIRARAQLAYGAWLRRQRRIAESREPLRTAAASFDTLGFRPWAARAGQELRASGDTTPAPAARAPQALSPQALSPQELEIAELAASGLTNRQIGRQLYLSPRTVATHLYRIFPKLGISSRVQLQQALGDPHAGPSQ
ncbi:MAG TPA: AAA family ATPase [Trebonia sp.]